jgi:hypothetical protein
MEQTAVEWLEDCFDGYGAMLKSDFTKAKAMEKEQEGYSEEEVLKFSEWFAFELTRYGYPTEENIIKALKEIKRILKTNKL